MGVVVRRGSHVHHVFHTGRAQNMPDSKTMKPNATPISTEAAATMSYLRCSPRHKYRMLVEPERGLFADGCRYRILIPMGEPGPIDERDQAGLNITLGQPQISHELLPHLPLVLQVMANGLAIQPIPGCQLVEDRIVAIAEVVFPQAFCRRLRDLGHRLMISALALATSSLSATNTGCW